MLWRNNHGLKTGETTAELKQVISHKSPWFILLSLGHIEPDRKSLSLTYKRKILQNN